MLPWGHLRAIYAKHYVNYIPYCGVLTLVRMSNGERRSVYLCVQQPILHRAWWSPSYGWLWICRLAYISKRPIHQLSNVAPHIWAWILHCTAYSSLRCQTHRMRDLDLLRKKRCWEEIHFIVCQQQSQKMRCFARGSCPADLFREISK